MCIFIYVMHAKFSWGCYKITINIVVAQELVHSMRIASTKKGVMAIKVNLEKANDRVRWNFL